MTIVFPTLCGLELGDNHFLNSARPEAAHNIIGELRRCVEKHWQVHLSPPWSSRYRLQSSENNIKCCMKRLDQLKVPKCDIFKLIDSRDFYTMKPLWVGDFGIVIKNSKIVSFWA
jgi:hypothetical protein